MAELTGKSSTRDQMVRKIEYRYTVGAKQEKVIHVALLTVFLIGFIKKGEIVLSKVSGVSSALLVVAALVVGTLRQRRNAEH